ncbi:MAG TPA: hypothetical protein VMJ10_24870 [Kofleriaceae bacterium]|nr:hypothetical protein [Kofleriaceae bacterium]
MKLHVCSLVLIVVGCHKPAETTNSGSAAGSGSGSGSAQAGSPGSAGSAGAAPSTSADANVIAALDDYDKILAPIWNLEPKARFAAVCAHYKELNAKALQVRTAASHWTTKSAEVNDAIEGFYANTNSLPMCCDQANDDASNDRCIAPVHQSFVDLVKLVPGAKPSDTHAGDAVPTATASAGSAAVPSNLKAKLQTADDALTSVMHQTYGSASELCKAGTAATEKVNDIVTAPDLGSPANATGFDEELGALTMGLPAFEGRYCKDGKLGSITAMKDSLAELESHTKKLLELASK